MNDINGGPVVTEFRCIVQSGIFKQPMRQFEMCRKWEYTHSAITILTRSLRTPLIMRGTQVTGRAALGRNL